MAESERVRVEIAFRSGQSLTVNIPVAMADELEAAAAKGASGHRRHRGR